MDSRNFFELFNALLDESDNENKEPNTEAKSTTSHTLENLFYITVLGFIAVVIYYTFFTGGSEGIDLSSFRRVIPEEVPKFSVNDDGEVFVSLLDENYNMDTSTQPASPGPIVSKHW